MEAENLAKPIVRPCSGHDQSLHSLGRMIDSSVSEVYLGGSNTVSTASTIYLNPKIRTYEKGEHNLSFLDLPYEIRLRIYHLIHSSSPILHQQLAPWSCISSCRTYTVQAMSIVDDGDASVPSHEATAPSPPKNQQLFPDGLLSPHRPLCRMPTSFTQTCRQIHAEARVIPFHENEFVFLNWFTLGLSSALAFVQGRQQWQRDEMRFMRLEVFAQDLVSDSARLADWVQLCGHLSGIWGLRLIIFVGGATSYHTLGRTEANSTSTELAPTEERGIDDMQKLIYERAEWISKGLARLRELRQLEVELVDVKWSARKKTEWCARLRELLEATKGETDVKIISVEKVEALVK